MATLSDVDIVAQMAAGRLIHGGSESQVGPACYELRMGTVYYDLTEGDKRVDASTAKTIVIKPGHRVVLITHEEIAVPENMIARVTSKGSLFSVGLSPVSTYADPGFAGNLGIVTQNLSDKYIVLPIGEPIAKIDFSLLTTAAKKPYSGQHGFQTQIWPIKHQLQKSYKEVSADPRVESEREEAYKILPRAAADIVKKLNRRQRNINAAILATLFLNTLVLAALSTNYLEPIVAVATNLLSTAAVALMNWWSKE